MGTNFFLRKKLSQEQRNEINKALDVGDFAKARELLPKDIHIGKRSGGWKFLWDAHYFKYFEPSKDALMKWLQSGQILDENGDEFTFDEFINEEIQGFIDKGYDIESYKDDHPDERDFFCYDSRILTFNSKCDYNININQYGEFYIGDFRFTVSEDFR